MPRRPSSTTLPTTGSVDLQARSVATDAANKANLAQAGLAAHLADTGNPHPQYSNQTTPGYVIAVIAGNGQQAPQGTNVAIVPVVEVRNILTDEVVSGISVTFAVTGGGGAVTGGSASTNAFGRASPAAWQLGTSAGTNTLTATVAGAVPVTFTAVATAPTAVPSNAQTVTGNNQSVAVGATLPTILSARFTDQFGLPVLSAQVDWVALSGGPVANPPSSITDSNGVATTTVTAGSQAGTQTVGATLALFPSVQAVFTLTASVAPPVTPPTVVTPAAMLPVGSMGPIGVSEVVAPPGGLTNVQMTLTPSATGTFPYVLAVPLNDGDLAPSERLISADDANLRAAVHSTYPSGSPRILIVAGRRAVTAGTPVTLTLTRGTGSGSDLTASAFSAVTNVTANFGATGTATRTSFSSPTRTWWSSPEIIHAQFVDQVGSSALRMVTWLTAFADGRVHVEVVIENTNVNMALTDVPAPAAVTVSGTVAVNGSTIRTVSGLVHNGNRSWHTGTWVGGTTPGVIASHTRAMLERCLWLPKYGGTPNAAAISLFTSAPFFTSGGPSPLSVFDPYPAAGMGGSGDGGNSWKAWAPEPDSAYLASGNALLARTIVEASKSLLAYNVHVRSQSTNRVPTFTELGTKTPLPTAYPDINFSGVDPQWVDSHQPASGLVPFLVDPKGWRIEVAQSIAFRNGAFHHPDWRGTPQQVYLKRPDQQVRALAWCLRNLGQAVMMTPDGDTWNDDAKFSLAANIINVQTDWDTSWNTLDLPLGDATRTSVGGASSWGTSNGWGQPLWQNGHLVVATHFAERIKAWTGPTAAAAATAADWVMLYPIRRVNEGGTKGAWRVHGYGHPIATDGTTDWLYNSGRMLADWNAVNNAQFLTGTLPETGQRPFSFDGNPDNATVLIESNANYGANVNYLYIFITALACARDRGSPGALAAWTKFTQSHSDWDRWVATGGDNIGNLRYNIVPRT